MVTTGSGPGVLGKLPPLVPAGGSNPGVRQSGRASAQGGVFTS